LPQGITSLNVEIVGSVEKQVHSGNGRGGQVLFLPVEISQHEMGITAMGRHIV